MPSMKKQYKTTFDEGTEHILWRVAGNHHKTVGEMLRILIATHPEIQAEAVNAGVRLEPETIIWGSKRETDKQKAG